MKDELAVLNLGSQIRKLRNKRQLTLQELADLTGLSKPNLSQIENNFVTPPIPTLLKIASALGVAIGYFFQESTQDDNIIVVRKDNRCGLAKGAHISHIGYKYEHLAYPRVDKHMEPFIVEIEERAGESITYNSHRGEEFLYVIEGELEFRSKEKTFILEQGDTIYFDSSIPHGYRGVAGSVKALVIIYHPS